MVLMMKNLIKVSPIYRTMGKITGCLFYAFVVLLLVYGVGWAIKKIIGLM